MTDYYTFQPVKMHRQILTSLVPNQMGKTVTLVENTSHRIRGKFGLWSVPGWVNALVHDCWVTAKIRSLPEIKLPIFGEFESNEDRLSKTILYEWGTARLELELLLGDSLGNWASFGETAIKNSNGYRYRKHRALDLMTDAHGFQLEENYKIAVRLVNVGFGDLTNQDKIDIVGAWTQEFIAVQQQPPYVVNNVYGSSNSPSPSPTPTPTPTPPAIPTLTLALASGTNTANANNDEKILLTIGNLPSGTQLSGKWFKGTTDTGIAETITTTGSPIELSTLKLRPSLSGSYSLQLIYNGITYNSNSVSVTVNPEITLSLSTGLSAASTGEQTLITVSGKYFTQSGSQAIIYQLLKTSDNSVQYTSTDNGSAVNSPQVLTNGEFTFTINSSVLASKTSGDYKLKFHFGSLSDTAYLSNNNVTVNITAAPPAITVSPTTVNTTTQGTAVSISRTISGLPSGFYPWVWQKDGTDLSGSGGTQYKASSSPETFSQALSTFSTGNGVYRIKLTANSTAYYSNTLTVSS